MTPIQAIRAKCLDCSAWSPNEVRLCAMRDCTLYPFRMGKNPNIKSRKASPKALEALKRAREAKRCAAKTNPTQNGQVTA